MPSAARVTDAASSGAAAAIPHVAKISALKADATARRRST